MKIKKFTMLSNSNILITSEKIQEEMISEKDADYTYEYEDYFKILPQINEWHLEPERIEDGLKVRPGFDYSSPNNNIWMQVEELRHWIKNISKNFEK